MFIMAAVLLVGLPAMVWIGGRLLNRVGTFRHNG
jgi:hypothetical protein